MARRQFFDDKAVVNLPVKPKRYALPDPDLVGHYVRVSANGTKSFAVVARFNGKQIWHTIGNTDHLTLREARLRGRAVIQRIKDGLSASNETPRLASYSEVYAEFFKREIRAKGLLSAHQIDMAFHRCIIPEIGNQDFISVRRGDVVALLDKIEDERGRRTADLSLAYMRRLSNWYSVRNENYQSPFVRGMARRVAGEGKRARILTDDELRSIWGATNGPYGALCRLALLTAQRREKLATMRWSDLAGNVWNIRHETRQKGVGGALQLPDLAMAALAEQPKFVSSDFVFSSVGDGKGFSGFSKCHARLLADSGTADWTLHDLRRTSRSLMSRAGIQSDHAERVLGHVIGGVEGVYDRHEYSNEKAIALAKLADLVVMILSPPVDNVVPLRGAQ